MCNSIIKDFFKSDIITSTIDINGILYISYDAYSCDSSFNENLKGIKYCPYCGQSIKKIFESIQIEEDKKIKLELKRKESKNRLYKIEQDKNIKTRIDLSLFNLNKGISNGNYNEYYIKSINTIRKGLSKQNLIDVLSLEGISISKSELKCVGVFNNNIKKLNSEEIYNNNKSLKVNDDCICPTCKSKFVKISYQQIFCKIKCKDIYWNNKK